MSELTPEEESLYINEFKEVETDIILLAICHEIKVANPVGVLVPFYTMFGERVVAFYSLNQRRVTSLTIRDGTIKIRL